MFTVALIGADGAGKTTIARQLENDHTLPIKYLYMGVSPLSSNVALPTTRFISWLKQRRGQGGDISGPPDPTRRQQRPRSRRKRIIREIKSLLHLLNRLAEEWYRQGVVWTYQRRGFIVLFDRHFFSDYYAHDIAIDDPNRSLASRIHGFILERLYPRPDLVIFLDAPAELLLKRKGEGTIALLESRRQEYLRLREQIEQFVIVDAARPKDDVLQEVRSLICNFQRVGHVLMPVGDV